jgi:hypothetical protein
MATPRVPTAILAAAAFVHAWGQVLGQHERADDLGVERPPDRVPVQVGDPAPGARGRGRHHVIDRAEPLAEGGDRDLVGQVNGLGGDPGLGGVSGAQRFGVAAGRDDLRAGLAGGQGDRSGEAAAAPDDQHGLVLQRAVHDRVLSRKGRM